MKKQTFWVYDNFKNSTAAVSVTFMVYDHQSSIKRRHLQLFGYKIPDRHYANGLTYQRKDGSIVVIFDRNEIGAGLVAHECFHATCRAVREIAGVDNVVIPVSYKKLDMVGESREEWMANITDELNRNFWNWYLDKDGDETK